MNDTQLLKMRILREMTTDSFILGIKPQEKPTHRIVCQNCYREYQSGDVNHHITSSMVGACVHCGCRDYNIFCPLRCRHWLEAVSKVIMENKAR